MKYMIFNFLLYPFVFASVYTVILVQVRDVFVPVLIYFDKFELQKH